MSSVPSERGELSSLLSHHAFFNDLTYIVDFFQTVQLRTEHEKGAFYSGLLRRLRSLHMNVISRRLSRLLLSRYVLLEPHSHKELYPELLIPEDKDSGRGLLSFELFQSYIVPELLRVFRVRDTSVRIALLSHFDRYAQYLPLNYLEGLVLEEVLLGVHDVDPRLVSCSLRAMAVLVSLLGTERVCPWKAVKNFIDGTPKMRSTGQREQSSSQLNCVNLSQFSVGPSPIRKELDTAKNDYNVEKYKRNEEDSLEEHKNVTLWDDDGWSGDWEKREDNVHNKTTDVDSTNTGASQIGPLEVSTVVRNANDDMIESGFATSMIKREAPEDDFFADMVPKIKTKGTLIDRLIALNEEKQMAESLSKFAMINEEIDDVMSWDDDVAVDVEDSLREGSTVLIKDSQEETRTRA